MNLPAIGESVPVFSNRLRITRDIIIGTEDNLRKQSGVEITGAFEYQACDDKICYLETSVPLKFDFVVQNQEIPRVPENLRRR